MDNPQTLKHVSLCAGYGGIDLGLARALGAVRTITFVEIEAFAVINLVKKIEAGHLDECPIFTDLKAFPWEFYRGRVDILSGGFPCQPFSAAGRRAGDSDPRHLWPFITDGIRRMGHPPLVFLENVEGIISSRLKGSEWANPEGTPVLLHVLRELERMGYQATAGVFSASEVGAPHQRKRVFILGCRSDLSETGRGLVDGLLRDTERGQEVAHTGCGTCWQRCRDGRATFEASNDRQTSKPYGLGIARPAWPTSRGVQQQPWEPPRITMGNTNNERLQRYLSTVESGEREQTNKRHAPRSSTRRDIQRQTQPSMGGNADGAPSGLDYAKLCHTVDNRTDELRLLGNGVVPATAERAFRVLWKDLRSR